MNFVVRARASDGLTFSTAVAINNDLLQGDYNRNGMVDAPDYNIWRDTFRSTEDLQADGNGNGVIDAADYNIWRDNFGREAGTAVPEPSSLVLVMLLICGMLGFRPMVR